MTTTVTSTLVGVNAYFIESLRKLRNFEEFKKLRVTSRNSRRSRNSRTLSRSSRTFLNSGIPEISENFEKIGPGRRTVKTTITIERLSTCSGDSFENENA